jgi:hypothetical protein
MPMFDLTKFKPEDQERLAANLKRVGAGDDLSWEARVKVLQETVAELLSALEKANIKTSL